MGLLDYVKGLWKNLWEHHEYCDFFLPKWTSSNYSISFVFFIFESPYVVVKSFSKMRDCSQNWLLALPLVVGSAYLANDSAL